MISMMYFVCIDKSYLKKYHLLLHLNHKKEKYAILMIYFFGYEYYIIKFMKIKDDR